MQVLAQVGSRTTCGVPDGVTLPVVLVALATGIAVEGIRRLVAAEPAEVSANLMLIVAVVGLVVGAVVGMVNLG